MKTVAVQVPIKTCSERVPGKNFLMIAGKPLFAWLLDRLVHESPHEWRVAVNTDNDESARFVADRYKGMDRLSVSVYEDWFIHATGSQLFNRFAQRVDADIIAQAYVTAPLLSMASILHLVDLVEKLNLDSATYATEETGWFWRHGKAVNYDPDRVDGLPRSQDAQLLKETTGIYVAKRESVLRTGVRLPGPDRRLITSLPRVEAMDIDTPEDFAAVEAELVSQLGS
jgi:CMP-N-acetylneuraminic acid synthetase